jgi:hypothetical protein
MDYWMRLGGTGMGFHRSNLWRPNGRWGSHGCLRMSAAGARWLHDWTPMGTPVKVVAGGTLYASAVRSSKNRTLAARPSRIKAATVAKVRPARAKRPVVLTALAKKKVPVAKPVATAPKPKPQPTLEKPQTVEPAPEVAPIETAEDEPVSEPVTQD